MLFYNALGWPRDFLHSNAFFWVRLFNRSLRAWGGEFMVVGFKKGREGERRGLVALLVDFKQKANNHAYRYKYKYTFSLNNK